MKTKDQTIETLRGMAIILVVIGYIAREDLTDPTSYFSNALRFICYLFDPVRLPLFTVISAYLYAASPVTRQNLSKLLTGKVRRLLIPFIAVSAMQYVFYAAFHIGGVHPMAQIYTVYLHPMNQFWFLLSIFWIFIIIGFLDSLKVLDTFEKWLICMGIAFVPHIFLHLPRIFAVAGVDYLFPFFLLGYGLRRFPEKLLSAFMIKTYIVMALLIYPIFISVYKWDVWMPLNKFLEFVVSFSVVPLIFHIRRTVPFFAKIGYYAFGIHLFNRISTAFPHLAFRHFNITDPVLTFVTYLSCVIVLSIGLQIIFEQFNFSQKYVLGLRGSHENLKLKLQFLFRQNRTLAGAPSAYRRFIAAIQTSLRSPASSEKTP